MLEELGIVMFYATLWAEQVPAYEAFGVFYAWLAVASLIVAGLALLLALFRRADGIQAAGLVGQHFLVVTAPYLIGAALAVGEAAPPA